MTITRDHFTKIVEETFGQIQALSKGKGTEYAGASEVERNELVNFDRLSAKLHIHPDKVLWVYLTKHLDSIENYINELDQPARKLSEPIEGRIDDAILYLILLKAMVIRRHSYTPVMSESPKSVLQEYLELRNGPHRG